MIWLCIANDIRKYGMYISSLMQKENIALNTQISLFNKTNSNMVLKLIQIWQNTGKNII